MFESVRLIAASPKRNCPIVRGAPGLIGSVVPEAPASRLPSATVLFRLCFGPQHGAVSCEISQGPERTQRLNDRAGLAPAATSYATRISPPARAGVAVVPLHPAC